MFRHWHPLALSLLLISLLCVVYVGEVGVYSLYSWWWVWPTKSVLRILDTTSRMNYNDDSKPSSELTKILVIADPHIQCTFDKYEPWLSRVDSDLYLQRGLGRLIDQLQPDMVVVLGDLFAEGYKASQFQWQEYLQCMHEVLAVPSGVRVMVLPGDNDIGGEGRDVMRTHINQRYITEFGPLNEVVLFNGVTLVKLDTVSYIHDSPTNGLEDKVRQESASFLKVASENTARGLLHRPVIIFTHVPLSEVHPAVRHTCLSSISPDYVFSGHLHHTRNISHTYLTVDGGHRAAMEWTVPTCSYRMGEPHMGVGAIIIDRQGRLGYSVLWLPPRYPVLLVYLLISLSLSCGLTYLLLLHHHRPCPTLRRYWT